MFIALNILFHRDLFFNQADVAHRIHQCSCLFLKSGASFLSFFGYLGRINKKEGKKTEEEAKDSTMFSTVGMRRVPLPLHQFERTIQIYLHFYNFIALQGNKETIKRFVRK